MAVDKQFPVHGDNGVKGTLFAPARFLDGATKKRIRLDDGRELMVAADSLVAEPDGSFFLKNVPELSGTQAVEPARPLEQFAAPAPVVPEPAAATVPLEPQRPAAPPRVISQHQGEPLFREDCDVKRVPIRRLIDHMVEPRQEGDTWIVPLVEEVLIVEKKLLLREELHITRRREQRADMEPIRFEDLQRESGT